MLRYSKGSAVWTIAQDGSTVTTSLDGVVTVEPFSSISIARTRFDILLGKQARDGWKRIKDEAPKPVLHTKPPPPAVEDARNLELEALILKDPHVVSSYRVYADWLEQQGDPRGRLIALSLALEATPNELKLQYMAAAYSTRIDPYIRRGVPPGWTVAIKRGFFQRIEAVDGPLAQPLRRVLATVSAAVVEAIQLDDDGSGELQAALAVVATAPRSLRTLRLGGRTTLEDLAPLLPLLRRLDRLELFNVHARELALAPEAWRQLLTAPMPRLGFLHLDVSAPTATLEPLFARTDLPKLTEVAFRSNDDPGLVVALANSPLAAQLTKLTLQRFPADQLETWRAVRANFPKLETLFVPAPWESDDDDVDDVNVKACDPERDRRVPGWRDPDDDGDDDDDDDDGRLDGVRE